MAKLDKNKTKLPFKFHIRTGDTVQVITGDDKGKRGVVLKIMTEKYRAIVEGAGMVKKHIKPSAANSGKGTIAQMESSLHISNLMLIDKSTGKPSRIGRKLSEDGKIVRYLKKSGKIVE